MSRRKIGRIMKREGLVSTYTASQFKPQKDPCNEAKAENSLGHQFKKQSYRNIVVSDLTYVSVGKNGITYMYLLTFLIETSPDIIQEYIKLRSL